MMNRKRYNYRAIFIAVIITLVAVLSIYYIYYFITKGSKKKWVELNPGTTSISRQVEGIILTDSLVYKTHNTGVLESSIENDTRINNGELVGNFICQKDGSYENYTINSSNQDIETSIKLNKEAIVGDVNSDFERLKSALKNSDKSTAIALKRDLIYNLEFLEKFDDVNSAFVGNVNIPVKMIGSSTAKWGDKFPIVATEAGFVSYYVDEYDGIINYEDRYGLDYEKIFNSNVVPQSTLERELHPNDVVLKLIGQKKWHLLLKMDTEDLDNFFIENRLEVTISGEQIVGIIVDKYKSKDIGILALEIDNYNSMLFNKRIVSADIKLDEVTGIEVPKAAIEYDSNGEQGVFVSGVDGDEIFRPVEILKQDGSDVVVVTPDVFTKTDVEGNVITIDTVSSGDKVLIRGE